MRQEPDAPSAPGPARSRPCRAPGAPWAIPLGASYAALSVAAGAFGAHALRGRVEPSALEWWETGARYLLSGGLGLILLGLTAQLRLRDGSTGAAWRAAGLALASGAAIFALTLGAMALGAPRWLGAITPLGGVGMIGGFVLFAVAASER